MKNTQKIVISKPVADFALAIHDGFTNEIAKNNKIMDDAEMAKLRRIKQRITNAINALYDSFPDSKKADRIAEELHWAKQEISTRGGQSVNLSGENYEK